MSHRLAFMALALALGACAAPPWVRPDTSAEQADKDNVECQRYAMNEATVRAQGFYGPSYYGPFYSRRAITRPDTGVDPFGYRHLDEAGLTDFCMRSKGYQRAR
jgi:hypothetical protein